YQLQLARLSPVITHPERNGLIQAQPKRLNRWIEQGCYVQVTAQSLLGRFGPKAQRLVGAWLDQDRIHFFASDAHNLTSRPLRLREAYEAVEKRRGKDVAQALFHDNPLAALEGRSLPYVPEPGRGAKQPSVRPRKRWFFF
ncbi:MAG TPA: CpsB/CapC family capsule biosynthesis tyrosine phosphatase, partial [Candidatus Acidoferrales bacterium]|nr:CpsB/CapC family capsule biosynthesis tyrosine phosphatase [Candidatus Acidoferrales bacterium]